MHQLDLNLYTFGTYEANQHEEAKHYNRLSMGDVFISKYLNPEHLKQKWSK